MTLQDSAARRVQCSLWSTCLHVCPLVSSRQGLTGPVHHMCRLMPSVQQYWPYICTAGTAAGLAVQSAGFAASISGGVQASIVQLLVRSLRVDWVHSSDQARCSTRVHFHPELWACINRREGKGVVSHNACLYRCCMLLTLRCLHPPREQAGLGVEPFHRCRCV